VSTLFSDRLSQAFMGKLFSELNDLKISDLLEAF
jgi:hypothetical protein